MTTSATPEPADRDLTVAFQLPPWLTEIRASARRIAEEVVAPRAEAVETSGAFPWDLKERLAAESLLGLGLPRDHGGGGSIWAACLVVEELSRVSAAIGLIPAVQLLGSLPLILGGNADQQARWLPGLARGDLLASFALTEPNAGSDAAGVETIAVTDGGNSYRLTGNKRFISGATVASLYTVFAKTDPTAGARGLSAFLVPADAPGLTAGPLHPTSGIRGYPVGELHFDGVPVPATNRLGGEGDGLKIALRTLDRSRPGIAAQAVGLAQGALDLAIAHSKARIQFGRPISDNQAISFRLADHATRIEAARLLLNQAAARCDQNDPTMTRTSAMAKLFCTDTAMDVALDAVQILGGPGFMKDLPAERFFRDAKITQIYEGTNEIQRLVIARNLLG